MSKILDLKGKTLYGALLDARNDFPNGQAIYYQGRSISFASFVRRVDRLANIMSRRLNIKEGDVILVAQPNIPDALVIFYALNKIGAIANMIHPFIPFNQVIAIMNNTNSKYMFLFEQRVAKEVERYRPYADKVIVTRVEDDLPLIQKFVYHNFMNRKIRQTLGKYRGSFKGFTYLKDLKPLGKGSPTVEDKEKATSVLLHSGSTTGDPKTICLSNWNFNFLAARATYFLSCEPEDCRGKNMLAVLPTFHGFGLCITMHAPLVNRCGVIMIPKFSSKAVVSAMNKTPMFSMTGVPTMYEALLKDPKFTHNKKLKNLYVAFCGGDSMSATLQEKWNNVMKENKSKSQIFEGYGLTEAICVNAVNTFEFNRVGSFGKAAPDVTFRIVDDNGNELPRGEIGEITLLSEATMDHYFNDPTNTELAIKDGWLYTGDLGYMDNDGYIFFVQRKKRVIKVSGVGVFPTEIERLIETVPGVEKCCAIGIPDPRLQSAIKVFVIAKYFDEQGMRNAILDTCRNYLIRWAVPKEIEFRKELPLTLLGKVDFKVLQKEEDEKRGVNK